MKKNEIAGTIDHTLLKAVGTEEQIVKLCSEAREYGFASVCVNPCYVALAAKELAGTDVKVCTVIGFPLGANTSEVKAFEARDAIANGAQEVDMVINIGALKSGKHDVVSEDIKAVVESAAGVTTKVIIETCYLDEKEKKTACELAQKAGADFVKTSTGFGTGGATLEDIKLMRSVVGDSMQIKASGGIREYSDAVKLLEAGANRLGASAGVKIVSDAE